MFCLLYFPDKYKTQEKCTKAVENYMPCIMFLIRRSLIMWGKTTEALPYALEYVPDWLATPKMLDGLDNDKDLASDEDLDELVGWYNDYKQYKDQGAPIKKELLPTGWHPF